jgi:uncharacterized protein YoxC
MHCSSNANNPIRLCQDKPMLLILSLSKWAFVYTTPTIRKQAADKGGPATMVAGWSAAVAAGTFVVLALGILIALRAALAKLEKITQATVSMQRELNRQASELAGLVQEELSVRSSELGSLMQQSEETMRAVQHQLKSATALFEAAGQVGGAIRHTTSAAEHAAAILSSAASRHASRAETSRRAGEALDWAELGMTAWQMWQANRKASAKASSDDPAAARSATEADCRDEGHANSEGSDSYVKS